MAEAIHLALSDAGGHATDQIGRVDALAVVNTLSWRYGDPARSSPTAPASNRDGAWLPRWEETPHRRS